MITQILKNDYTDFLKVRSLVEILIVFSLLTAGQIRAQEAIYARPDEEYMDANLKEKYSDIEQDTLKFLDEHRSSVTGLVESYQNSSLYYYIPAEGTFEKGHEPHLARQSFTYDIATAAMIYSACGEQKKARQILDNMQKEFYRPKNGAPGLYTSYLSDQVDENDNLVIGIDGDRVHVGPTMWVALATIQYIRITGDGSYLPWVIDMAKWVSTLPHFIFKDNQKGAVSMGHGWGPDWSQVYSTENCIDYYSILFILKNVCKQCSDKVKQEFVDRGLTDKVISREIAGLERWFKEVAYNKDTGGFNAGYNENGIDRTKALDTVSNSLSVIGPVRLAQWGIDPFRLIEFAEKDLMIKDTIKGKSVEGFDFTIPEEIGNPRRRLIWIEGTAQMVLAYKIMSKYSSGIGNQTKAEEYKKKAIKIAKELDKIAELVRLPKNALPYTSDNPGDKERLITYKYEWEIPRGPDGKWVGSIASTAWRFFSLSYYNPMMLGKIAFKF
ncbi:MAG: hypothetical protein PHD29_02610 [bacterium]|nr:hypothetical protein [bacterium]MDD5354795.1 hypothetical protein [bacterium]MDD5755962.1 hypothetical protein [bacterium]